MPNRVFIEHVDPVKCTQVLQLPKSDIRKIFYVHNPEEDWDHYWNRFSEYLRYAISKKGTVQRTYKYAKGASSGRWYVEKCGVQSLQGKLRKFICGDLYYDIDLVNCHPRIFLWLCKCNGIAFPMLEEYVSDRARVLADNCLTKKDINVAMNIDKNRKRHGNDFFNYFIYQLEFARDKLLEKLDNSRISPPGTSKNPKSSQISKHLQLVEEEVMQVALEYFDVHAEVPMFDGLMVSKSFCKPKHIESHIQNLNELLEAPYNGLLEFALKSTESEVVLANMENANVAEEYEVVKKRFEEQHFQTVSPFIYWKQYMDSDGMMQYGQLTSNEFRLACKEFPIIEYRPSGTLMVPPPCIYDKWIEDANRRKYQSIDFIPYGNEDTCPPHIFNTFDGFRINKEKPEESFEEVSINNFRQLIWNLCGEELDMADYLMKYIAHMFQYPNVLTEKIIVLRSWTGCGKDTLHRILSELMGFQYVGMTGDPDAVFGTFNEISDSKIVIFLNEMEGKDGIQYQEKMKHYASAKKIRVNAKYNKPVWQNNYARLFINSNQDGCVNLQVHDRRFVIINSGFGLVQNTSDKEKSKRLGKFWDRLYNNLGNYNWKRSVYQMLMDTDLTGWSPKQVPQSKHHDLLRRRNINPLHEYLREIIDTQNFGAYEKRVINKKDVHLIKWKPWFRDYKLWVERQSEVEYVVKSNATKVKLATMNKGWEPPKLYRIKTETGSKVEWLSAFDFSAIKEFLDDYVFRDQEQGEVIDLTDEDSNATPSAMSSSVDEF